MERYNVILTSIFPQPNGFGTARTVINPQPLSIEAASDLATERRNQGAVVTLEAVRTCVSPAGPCRAGREGRCKEVSTECYFG